MNLNDLPLMLIDISCGVSVEEDILEDVSVRLA